MKIVSFGLALCMLAGCVSQEQMDAAPVQRVLNFSENYQRVYERANRGMRYCNTVGPISVDGQLYSDLGYGEITTTSGGWPLDTVRVSQSGTGTKVEMKTNVKVGTEGALNWLEYWARGGLKCPALLVTETPPPLDA